ncbi:MAG TPA: hypothetical protein VJ917_05935, partial [Saprospiraceae bacterium]|nr:hypothetical protein [Saprospiraceae bacterium]
MKINFYSIILSLAAMFSWMGAQAQEEGVFRLCDTLPEPIADIAAIEADVFATGQFVGRADDADFALPALSFPVTIFNANAAFTPGYSTTTQLWASTNGWLSDANGFSDLGEDCTPPDFSNPGNHVFVLHDDLDYANNFPDDGIYFKEYAAGDANHPGHPYLGTDVNCAVILWKDGEEWVSSTEFDMALILYDVEVAQGLGVQGNPYLASDWTAVYGGPNMSNTFTDYRIGHEGENTDWENYECFSFNGNFTQDNELCLFWGQAAAADDGNKQVACEDEIQVSLGTDGTYVLDCAALRADTTTFDTCFVTIVSVNGDTGDGAVGTNIINCTHLGDDVYAMVTVRDYIDEDGNGIIDDSTSNFCWTRIVVEDKLAPTLECPAPLSVDCNEDAIPGQMQIRSFESRPNAPLGPNAG